MKFYLLRDSDLTWATQRLVGTGSKTSVETVPDADAPTQAWGIVAPSAAAAEATFRRHFRGQVPTTELRDFNARPWWVPHVYAHISTEAREWELCEMVVGRPEVLNETNHAIIKAAGPYLALFSHVCAAHDRTSHPLDATAIAQLVAMVKAYPRASVVESQLARLGSEIVTNWGNAQVAAAERKFQANKAQFLANRRTQGATPAP